ncbi:MAG TPA: hypothetical protein VEX43_07515, partial [Chthoniobacterales bacterium]|nr:hypothetical protein [Chthoniobacterales bacterium]
MANSPKKKSSKKPAKAKASSRPKAKKAPAKPSKPVKKAAAKPAAKKAPVAAKKSSARPGKTPRANGAQKKFASENATQTILSTPNHKQKRLDPFVRGQKDKLLQLRDAMVDSMAGVAKDNLRSRAEGSEASAFGMHQA